MTSTIDFHAAFTDLTGSEPFPWQQALYESFVSGNANSIPACCNLPTGLGKTSVIAIWLIALANHPGKLPRRLVYVVNRRTVVDQTTIEVEKIRKHLLVAPSEIAKVVIARLRVISGRPAADAFAISTLRGQFADNREWSADPSRPAVIVGTVDMIGSRLLFSGYGVGFKWKPLHAGFLGQDVLLVHDESHLEPAFQKLLGTIQDLQMDEPALFGDQRRLKVMELSATSRGLKECFGLTDQDRTNLEVRKRIEAKKTISLHSLSDPKKLGETIAELAQGQRTKDRTVLIFVRKLDDVEKVLKQLPKGATQQLTGTLRGLERDQMADPRKKSGCPIFARFLKPPRADADATEKWEAEPQPGTVYLVCTSAGEVGANISADQMVCDLSTFESMAQRFGRVNRFGECDDTEIHIVHPAAFDGEEIEIRREKTLEIMRQLNGDGSPKALDNIPLEKRLVAFTPEPKILPASNILFDAWGLTTIKDVLPGRPQVEPFLHGVEDAQAAETQFAWREEVALLTGKVGRDNIEEALDQARLKPHELLRVTTFGKGRAYDQLQKIADRDPELPVWVVEPDGSLIVHRTISGLVEKKGVDYVVPLAFRTVILPPQAGGLTAKGTLDGAEPCLAGHRYDIAGLAPESPPWRFKVRIDSSGDSWLEPVSSIMGVSINGPVPFNSGSQRYRDLNALLRKSNLLPVRPKFSLELGYLGDDDESSFGIREYLVLQPIRPKTKLDQAPAWPTLSNHSNGVREFARDICNRLEFPQALTRAIELSGAWHDLGKGRGVWQRGAGNQRIHASVAKTIHGRAPENLNRYRHELGSMIDVCSSHEFAKEFDGLTDDQQDIVLHLIAGHHGRARPYFPDIEAHDIESSSELVASVVQKVPSRFARLQRKFGRWGLAYLESILRAADVLDSQRIETTPLGDPVIGDWPKPTPKALRTNTKATTPPSIRFNIDPTNPGQFFACCGLMELANQTSPGAEGWFEKGQFCVSCLSSLSLILNALADCDLTNTMAAKEWLDYDQISLMSTAARKQMDGAEERYKELSKLVREAPIVLRGTIDITLDWFTDDYAGGSRFKTWAGQQSVLGIATSMKESLSGTSWRNEDCLNFSSRECGLPFNFDSDLGGQGGAIDIGFSFDPLAGSALTRIELMARPALELLAFIGLQRFRPGEIKGENRYIYTTWNRPLPIAVAAPAACGALPIPGSSQYEFRLLYRTKYLKSFLPAIPFSGGSDE